jgi:hypothetical protein
MNSFIYWLAFTIVAFVVICLGQYEHLNSILFGFLELGSGIMVFDNE